jgi:serine/alanine adding enzyme
MTTTIKIYEDKDSLQWDNFVKEHRHSNCYQLSGWIDVLKKTYRLNTYHLMAFAEGEANLSDNNAASKNSKLVGVLSLFHLKHFIFGNSLISAPYFDIGGILADDLETERFLAREAIRLGKDLGAENIELRQAEALKCFMDKDNSVAKDHTTLFHSGNGLDTEIYIRNDKVRMLLELPDSSDALMKSFKSKLRSQIKKPMKDGLEFKIGGLELVDDFYDIFVVNMRDLGSPVHSKNLMSNVMRKFPDRSRIVIVYKEKLPMAASMVIGFKQTLLNPWASSLREYSSMSPNMLLYWAMLSYACESGYRYFDFGRSTPDEGTYKFKAQWGAQPKQLFWYEMSLRINKEIKAGSQKDKFNTLIQWWQKLPVTVTRFIGPPIRKHIGL